MKRFDYLDISKGIGILMVVWAHIMLVGASHKLIYAFHMPLFFFISGMLFNKNKYGSFAQFLKHRSKRLLIPYVAYSIGTWGIWAIFRYLRHDDVDSYFMPLLQTFIAQGSGEFLVHNSALWFIPCLFAVEIMYYLFKQFEEWVSLSLCFAAAGLGWLLTTIFGADYLFLLPWNFDAALFALPFYGVANSIRQHFSHNELMQVVKKNRVVTIISIAILFILMSYLAIDFNECSMGSSLYGCFIPIFFLRAFLGCFALIGLSLLICSFISNGSLYNLIKWCGKNSLDIMCLHIPVKGVMIIAVSKALHLSFDIQENLIYSGITFIFTIIIMVPLIFCIKNISQK